MKTGTSLPEKSYYEKKVIKNIILNGETLIAFSCYHYDSKLFLILNIANFKKRKLKLQRWDGVETQSSSVVARVAAGIENSKEFKQTLWHDRRVRRMYRYPRKGKIYQFK